MVYVELSKFQIKNISDLHSEREIWLYLLNNNETLTEESRMEILAKKPDLKYAFDIMDLYASDPEKRRELEERIRADKNYAYELAAKFEQGLEKGMEQGMEKGMEQGMEKGMEKGMEQGIEKGEFKKALETARKMRKKGFSNHEISELTGLSGIQLKENGFE
jgi:flagellar biosynthesis/type III secretory pathway protein FliH